MQAEQAFGPKCMDREKEGMRRRKAGKKRKRKTLTTPSSAGALSPTTSITGHLENKKNQDFEQD